MGSHIDEIVESIKRNVPIEGDNTTVTDAIGGTGRRISARSRGGGVGTTSAYPFQILSAGNIGDDPAVGVSYYSSILKSLSVDDELPITGLLDLDGVSGGFVIPEIGQKIYIVITLNNVPAPTAAAITHGDPWDEYPDPVSINTDDPDAPFVEFFNQIIAEVVASTDLRNGTVYTVGTEARKIVPLLTRNLRLELRVINGLTGLVPVTGEPPASPL